MPTEVEMFSVLKFFLAYAGLISCIFFGAAIGKALVEPHEPGDDK